MGNPNSLKPLPKNEQHICNCGAKFKTVTALESHVRKLRWREVAGWEKKGHHFIRFLIKHGTEYTYG